MVWSLVVVRPGWAALTSGQGSRVVRQAPLLQAWLPERLTGFTDIFTFVLLGMAPRTFTLSYIPSTLYRIFILRYGFTELPSLGLSL